MTTDTNPQFEADPQSGADPDILAPEQLAGVREARGWSKSEVAAKLGMMPRQIDAMENGRWQDLPGHAFVRAGLRAYGKVLQVDVAPLLATLADPGALPELRRSASLDSPLPRRGALGFGSGGSGSRIAWVLLGVVGVVVIALYFARGTEPEMREPVSMAGDEASLPSVVNDADSGKGRQVAVPADAAAVTADGGADPAASGPVLSALGGAAESASAEADASAPGRGSSSAEPSGNPVPASGGAAAAAAASARTAEAASGSTPGSAAVAGTEGTSAGSAASSRATLLFHFERESWVEVRDGDGQVLMRGLQSAGSRREVSGPKPWAMTIGNADFVRVERDGNPVDLGPVTQKGVARLRID